MKAKLTTEWNALLDPFASEAKWLPTATAVERLGLSTTKYTIVLNKAQKLLIGIFLAFILLFALTILSKQIGNNNYREYGYQLADQHLWAKAITAFNTAIWMSDGKDAYSYFGKAYCETEIGNYKSAIKDYTASLAYNVTSSCAFNNLGNIYEAIGDKESALTEYNNSISLSPKHASHFINRGELLKDLGRVKEASNDFAVAVSIANSNIQQYPNDPSAYADRASALFGLGSYERALSDSQQAIKLDPDNVDFRLIRAKLSFAKGNFASGINDLNLYISVNGRNPEGYLELAKANEALGNPTIAVMYRSKAAALEQQARNSV